jgi:hypothetical protein
MSDTGYRPGTIYRHQASSSGQLMTISTGCAVLDNNIDKSTSTALSRNHGVHVINTTKMVTLAHPVKGCRLDIVLQPTSGKGQHFKTGSTAIFINSSNGKDFIVTVAFGSSSVSISNHGFRVALFGQSTKQWYAGLNLGSTHKITAALAATS